MGKSQLIHIVPVISGNMTQASWSLPEDYCRSTLLLHWPNWRNRSDIKSSDTSWIEVMKEFLKSNDCPSFVKAAIERAKKNYTENCEDEYLCNDTIIDNAQPDWMEMILPNVEFEHNTEDFIFVDGGDGYNCDNSCYEYTSGLGKQWTEQLVINSNVESNILQLPDVNPNSMNEDQRLAFNIVMNKLRSHPSADKGEGLRLIITGTAGTGKSFLIKCLDQYERYSIKKKKKKKQYRLFVLLETVPT